MKPIYYAPNVNPLTVAPGDTFVACYPPDAHAIVPIQRHWRAVRFRVEYRQYKWDREVSRYYVAVQEAGVENPRVLTEAEIAWVLSHSEKPNPSEGERTEAT